MSAPVFATCSAKARPPSAPFSLFSFGLLDPRAKASGPSEQPTGSASGPAEQPTGSASGPAEPAGGGSEPAGGGSGALGHVDESTQYPEPAGGGSGAYVSAAIQLGQVAATVRQMSAEFRAAITEIRAAQSLPASSSSDPVRGGSGAETEAREQSLPAAAPVEENERGHMVPVTKYLYWDQRANQFYNSKGEWCDSEGRLLPHNPPAGTWWPPHEEAQGPPHEEAQGPPAAAQGPPAAAQDPPGGGGSAHTATTAQGFGFPLPTATERGFLLRTTAWDERIQQEVSVILNAQTGQFEREAQDPPAAAQGPPAAAQGPPAATRSRRAHSTGPPQDTRRGRANRYSWGSHSSGSRDGDWNRGRW